MNRQSSIALAIISILCGILIPVAISTFAAPCQRMLETSTGMMVHMKCFWSSQVYMVFGVLIVVCGLLQLFARSKESHRYLGIMQIAMTVVVFMIPTSLVIGICSMPMACSQMASVIRVVDAMLLLIGLLFVLRPNEAAS